MIITTIHNTLHIMHLLIELLLKLSLGLLLHFAIGSQHAVMDQCSLLIDSHVMSHILSVRFDRAQRQNSRCRQH